MNKALLGFAIFALMGAGQSFAAGECGDMTRFEKVTVKLTIDGDRVTGLAVDREDVTIYFDDPTKPLKVCWTTNVELPAGSILRIATKAGKEDPFAHRGETRSPRAISGTARHADSARPRRKGEWVYELLVEKERRGVTARLDPRVIIK